MANKGKYYMTTAIAYTSGKPHIGNTYEIILADAIADTREQRDTTYISRQEQMSMDRKSRKRLRQPEFHRRSM